jgi:hypothetical protein
MEEFKERLLDFESHEWDDEEHDRFLDLLDLDAVSLIICRAGPFDLNSKEELALMVCEALFLFEFMRRCKNSIDGPPIDKIRSESRIFYGRSCLRNFLLDLLVA